MPSDKMISPLCVRRYTPFSAVKMGWCTESGWLLLVSLTVLTVLLSVAISITGGIFNFSPNLLLDLFMGNPDEENIQSLPAHTGYTPVCSEVGVAFMVLGVAMCVLSFLACIGGCCKCRGLLIAFSVFNTFVVCAITVTAAMFMDKRSDLHTAFQEYLSDTVRSLYEKDPDGFFIKILSAMSLKFSCCGVTGPGDLDPDWMVDPDNVMTSCCKSLTDTSCPSDSHDIYQEGCYETIRDLVLDNNKTWITLSVSLMLVVMSLQTVTASAIVLDNHRNKVEPN